MSGRTSYQTILQSLRRDIIHGTWEPGQKLVEQDLASRYHVSRTPLREAIRQLQVEGMINAIPNRGARVATLTLTGLNELFEVRELLECHAIRKSTQYMPQEEIARLKSLMLQMKDNYDASHMSESYELVAEFHKTLMTYCRNAVLQQLIASVIERFAPFRYLMVSSKGSIRLYGHLEKIAAFLENRDANAIVLELRASLATYKDIIFEEVLKTHPKLIKQDVTE